MLCAAIHSVVGRAPEVSCCSGTYCVLRGGRLYCSITRKGDATPNLYRACRCPRGARIGRDVELRQLASTECRCHAHAIRTDGDIVPANGAAGWFSIGPRRTRVGGGPYAHTRVAPCRLNCTITRHAHVDPILNAANGSVLGPRHAVIARQVEVTSVHSSSAL